MITLTEPFPKAGDIVLHLPMLFKLWSSLREWHTKMTGKAIVAICFPDFRPEPGLLVIDHIVGNLPDLTMNNVIEW